MACYISANVKDLLVICRTFSYAIFLSPVSQAMVKYYLQTLSLLEGEVQSSVLLCAKVVIGVLNGFFWAYLRFKVIISRSFLRPSWKCMAMKHYTRDELKRLFENSFLHKTWSPKTWLRPMKHSLPLLTSSLLLILQFYTSKDNKMDGCATFFRRDRFSHVTDYKVLHIFLWHSF